MSTVMSVTLTYLQSQDSRKICNLFGNAYHADPVFRYIFDDPKINYDTSLRSLFREEIQLHTQRHQPLIGATDGEVLVGAACVFEPGLSNLGEREWNWRMRMLMSSGVASTSRFLDKELRISQALLGFNCHRLNLLGVRSDWCHQGVGDTLLTGVDSLVEEHPNSEGSAIFVSDLDLMPWLSQHGYQEMSQVEFGNFTGKLAFRPRTRG